MSSKKFTINLTLFIVALLLIIAGLSAELATESLRVKHTNLTPVMHPAQTQEITIEFNKDVDQKDIESRFTITPKLDGTIRWNGKTLSFIPKSILPYGKTFDISITAGAKAADGKLMDMPFHQTFQIAPLRLVYMGTDGTEKNQLIMISPNDAKHEKTILSDGTLSIEHFTICPDGNCIYMLAYKDSPEIGNKKREIYRIDIDTRKTTQITHDAGYQNTSFSLSPDGSMLMLTRYNITKGIDSLPEASMWIGNTSDYHFTKIPKKTSGPPLLISPDNQYILYQDENGALELSGITKSDIKDNLYVGNFSTTLGFHPSKPLILLIKDIKSNSLSIDNSLVIFNSDGKVTPITDKTGIFHHGLFTPDGKGIITSFVDEKNILMGSYFFHIMYYDLEKKTFSDMLSDTEAFTFSDESPAISLDGNTVAFLRYEVLNAKPDDNPFFRIISDNLTEDEFTGGELTIYNKETSQTTDLHMKAKAVEILP